MYTYCNSMCTTAIVWCCWWDYKGGLQMPLITVFSYVREIWSNMFCFPWKQPILALMKSCSTLSWEVECWKHANALCCDTERVGFGLNCEFLVMGFVFSWGPMISLVLEKKGGLGCPYESNHVKLISLQSAINQQLSVSWGYIWPPQFT